MPCWRRCGAPRGTIAFNKARRPAGPAPPAAFFPLVAWFPQKLVEGGRGRLPAGDLAVRAPDPRLGRERRDVDGRAVAEPEHDARCRVAQGRSLQTCLDALDPAAGYPPRG